MVDLARVEAGSSAKAEASSSVDEIFSVAMERAAALERDIQVKPGGEFPLVAADARAVGQVLYNLLENAAKYSPDDSPIVLAASTADELIEISVVDKGPGIPVKMREQVFEKFYRLDGRTRGLGLGLAIAKGIVEAQGGSIRIDNGDNGIGTRVVVSLPRAEDGR
jgi:two-component system sensor histidine kinase KdpD